MAKGSKKCFGHKHFPSNIPEDPESTNDVEIRSNMFLLIYPTSPDFTLLPLTVMPGEFEDRRNTLELLADEVADGARG